MQFRQIRESLKFGIAKRLNLHLDKAKEDDVITELTKNSDFIGANLWTLIFAILIASIGLNVNSTAVIIGAMLISPLMGPIMGIGLGLGINDFELVKKGVRNLLVATIISVLTSAIYFLITPLDDAKSELLARTTPSLYDVFIAFFGGLAGIVAATRKEKNNVIPGVAIATALMPPLCTAGYGLAAGNIYYFLGAIYLYSINSVFICISTFLIIRFLKFERRHFEDKRYERKVSRYTLVVIIITVLPSIYLTLGIVRKSIFASNAAQFVKEQFRFVDTQVVNKTFVYDGGNKTIDLLLIGYELPQKKIDSIRKTMHHYGLEGVKLTIHQGLNAKQEIDFSQIKASILEDVFQHDSTVVKASNSDRKFPFLLEELKALYPGVRSYSATPVIEHSMAGADSITLVTVDFGKAPSTAEQSRLERWLKSRLPADSVKLIVE